MAYNAKAVANYYLDLAERKGEEISSLKLQKILYFAHGWHLGITEKPLLKEHVEAWRYGPVIPSVYYEFRDFGSRPITRKAMDVKGIGEGSQFKMEIYTPSLTPEDSDRLTPFLDRIWEVYSPCSPIQLSNMTHKQGTPWAQVRSPGSDDLPDNAHIPDEYIKKHFEQRLQKK